MIVTTSALKGQAKKGGGESLHAIANILDPILLLDAAPLGLLLV